MPYKDKEKRLEVQRRYRVNNLQELKKKAREYMSRPLVKERYRKQNMDLYYSQKKQIFDIYGWICNCCGEKNPKFLTIDHVFNDGFKDREAGRE